MTLKPSDWLFPRGGPEGFKGGGNQQRTPVESPDSLRSIATFRILDLISEGEIGGLVNGQQSIFLNETPLQNHDGTFNFQGVQVDTRNGTQDQTYLPGFPAVENENVVNVELKSAAPWIQRLSNVQLSAVRVTIGTPALQQTNTSNGDVTGYSIQYHIDVQTDGGAYQTAYVGQMTGKTTTKYQQSIRVDLPPAASYWQIRVTRDTVNANSATIADTTTIDGYTEIIDGKLRYPNSALVGISGDASQFTNIPARAYDVFLRIVQVPSNYDPQTRTYTGTWDGTFKPAWTNNPAWCIYDLILNPRYGLGTLINGSQVNKWELYRIGQYCDQMVDDGKGGQEPRFTLNCYLQSAEDAFKLLSDVASAFNGVSYWGGGTIITSSDMPGDPTVLYTQANVVGGLFTYSSTPRKTRYSTALVTWNDPADFYRAKVEYYEDQTALARFGIQPASMTAFGCTSQGQAQRIGHWAVISSQVEPESVTFSVGLDGAVAAPGQIVRVADAARAGARMGGRLKSSPAPTRIAVTVDNPAPNAAVGDSLTVTLPTGATQTLALTSVNGASLQVAPPGFDAAPEIDASWMIEKTTLVAQTFRVLSVAESQSGPAIGFTITALQHNESKFSAIDDGTVIQIPPISGITPNSQAPPTNVTLAANALIAQGIANAVLWITWTPAAGALQYSVEWRRNNGNWISAGTISGNAVEVQGIYSGNYVARVRAISPSNIVSLPAYSAATDIVGKTGEPPAVTFLTATSVVFGIDIAWGFPPGAEDTQRTELWYSQSPQFSTATVLSDLSYPTNTYKMQGLAAGVGFYFWARLVDTTGNLGPFYPDQSAQGVYGESSTDANAILDYLTGQITETQLSQDLVSQIDQIPINTSNIATMADQIGAQQGEIDSINGIISEFNPPTFAGDDGTSDTGFAGNNTVYAGVWSESYARATADDALAKRIDTVEASTEGFQAMVESETTARINADEVLAQNITTVQATADNALGTANTATATIQTETTARISGDNVNAQAIQTTQASLGTTNANVQTNANAIVHTNGIVSASYNIKVQIDPGTGQYVAAGMAVGIDNAQGYVQSQILFYADRFALLQSANGVISSPFVIQNGQVFISQAFIGTAWIGTANIQDAAITNAKIGAAAIGTANIADANVTNAKIGSYIQSNNYDGTNGWNIDKSGSAYFGGNVTVKGMVTATSISGQFQATVEASGAGPNINFTLGGPIRAGDTHYPVILVNYSATFTGGGGGSSDGVTLYLAVWNGSAWVRLATWGSVVQGVGQIFSQFYVDTPQTAPRQYQLQLIGGTWAGIDSANIAAFGLR